MNSTHPFLSLFWFQMKLRYEGGVGFLVPRVRKQDSGLFKCLPQGTDAKRKLGKRILASLTRVNVWLILGEPGENLRLIKQFVYKTFS